MSVTSARYLPLLPFSRVTASSREAAIAGSKPPSVRASSTMLCNGASSSTTRIIGWSPNTQLPALFPSVSKPRSRRRKDFTPFLMYTSELRHQWGSVMGSNRFQMYGTGHWKRLASSRISYISRNSGVSAHEPRPSRFLRRSGRASRRRDRFGRLPPPRYRGHDPGIEPGFHRRFGCECRTAGDRPELSGGRRRPAVGRQCLPASPERAPAAGRRGGRPFWPPPSPDSRCPVVWPRFAGLRGGAYLALAADRALRPGCAPP